PPPPPDELVGLVGSEMCIRDSNDTDYITIGIDNQEPIKLLASYKDKELVRTIINENIVEKAHDDINNAEFTDGIIVSGIDDRSDIGIDSN
ncbi:hypothetical protein ACQ7A7_28135, partial [Escherichia coli]